MTYYVVDLEGSIHYFDEGKAHEACQRLNEGTGYNRYVVLSEGDILGKLRAVE